MSPLGRWSLIALAAIGTGVAAFLAPDSDHAVETAATVARARAIPVAVRAPALGELPKRQALARQRADMFEPHSWTPPAPPPPPQVQQEVAPQPPPNPYRFAGTVEYGGSRKVLLTRADRIFEVKEGEVLEQGFRVQAVTPQAVTLLYEPLDAPVTVALVFQEAPAQAALPQAAAGRTAPPPLAQPVAQPVPQAVPHAPALAPSSPSPSRPGSPLSPPGIVPGGATAR